MLTRIYYTHTILKRSETLEISYNFPLIYDKHILLVGVECTDNFLLRPPLWAPSAVTSNRCQGIMDRQGREHAAVCMGYTGVDDDDFPVAPGNNSLDKHC